MKRTPLLFLLGLTLVAFSLFHFQTSHAENESARSATVNIGNPDQDQNSDITVVASYQNDTSIPLRKMKPLPVVSKTEHEANENPKIPTTHKDSPDPVVQDQFDILTNIATPNMPSTMLNFDGIPFPGVSCNCTPPDTNGEAGATQYVQIVNEGFQVFNKTTGVSQLGPVGISTIWSGFNGPCETAGHGDPVVLYDQLANRWLISQFAGVGIPTDECIAISTTSDATGSYHRYAFHLGSNFFDYPKLSVWPDAYYMAMAVFNSSGTAYLGPQPFAFDRARMLAGLPATFITTGITGGPNEPLYLPADLDGSITPPAGAPASFIEWPGTGTYRVFHFHVDFANPLNSTFTLFASPAAAGFTERTAGIPQLGTASLLDPIGDRLMFRAATRFFPDGHESLVSNFTVQSGGVAAVRWFELRNPTLGPVSVFQQSTYQPDATHRWMGSAAMDRQGNLAIGYSASSNAINPQIRYAGRRVGDPLNTLAQTEATLFAGTGSQNSSRWGDYSALTIDPVDDCTFWYTQEYSASISASNSNWRTRIGSFQFPGCFTRTLTVASSNPNSGVSISVSPDINGSGEGTTQFSRTYNNNTQVSLGAPALGGGNNFQKWQRNGVDWSTNQLTSVVMDANYTMTAIYAPGPGPAVAAYDPTLKAPKCGPGSSCDSGTLLNGRGNIPGGPEPNQPNTINNSCSDGSLGTYHVEESIDRIKVATRDGSTLAPGRTVTYEVTYWASSTEFDFLDFYYLSDVSSSNWSYMTTLRPQTTGLQVVTVFSTLAGIGNLQAVRVVLRSGGSVAPCSPGNFNDHDDLVFAAPAPPPTLMIESANPVSGVNITVSPNDINGLGNGATQFTRTYNYLTLVTLTAPATVNGKVFSKWRLNGFDFTSSLTASVNVAPFTTMTAVYETPRRTLTVASINPASGVNIMVSPTSFSGLGDGTTEFSRIYDQNTSVNLIAPATVGGNNFQKWQRDGADWSFSPETTVTLDTNHTMTAVYVTPQRTLTVASTNPASGVSVTVSPNDNSGLGNGTTQFSRTYNQNTTVSLTAPATAGGNNFQKWQRNGVDWSVSQATNVTLDANYTMTAIYVTPQRTLTVASTNPASGVSITVTPNDNSGFGNGTTQFSRTYNHNTTVNLMAPATAGGNNFQKWQRNGVDWSFSQGIGITLDADYTMTAIYVTPQRTLTVTSINPASGVSISVSPTDNIGLANGITPFSRTYNQNTTVSLIAPATAGGNNFQKWQRNGVDWSTSQTISFPLDADYTMTAVYVTPQRTLTVASTNPASGVSITVSPNDNSGLGNGTTQFSRTYNQNTTVSLTAPATVGGNNFQKWQRNGVDWSTNQATNVTLDTDYTMTAVYVLTLASGLKGHWKFDENTGTTAADASGTGNTGTLTSGAAWGAGQIGAAVSVDGLDDYVQVGAQASLVMTSAASFTAWIHPTGAGSHPSVGGTILVKEGEYVLARFPNGSIQWGFANSNPGWQFIDTGFVAPLNQWTHIAVTYDNGTIKTYANGSLVHTFSGVGPIGDAITGQNDFRIGGRQVISQQFQGRIDEVRVYNRAVTASEITQIMGGLSAGLKGYWKFDENTGTTAADASGTGNTGTLTSGAAWGTGQTGAAVSVDGLDDYVQVGAQASLVMTSAASFTAWIHPTGAGSHPSVGGTILVKEGEYVIARFPNGSIQWGFANSNPGWQFIDTGFVAPLNQWTHIAITYDNGTIKTYANGSLVHTFSGVGPIGDAITGQNDFRIGGRQVISQQFQGKIDEVRVYNRAVTASEITQIMSQ